MQSLDGRHRLLIDWKQIRNRQRRSIVKKILALLIIERLAAAASDLDRDEIAVLVAFNELKPVAPFSSESNLA